MRSRSESAVGLFEMFITPKQILMVFLFLEMLLTKFIVRLLRPLEPVVWQL